MRNVNKMQTKDYIIEKLPLTLRNNVNVLLQSTVHYQIKILLSTVSFNSDDEKF